MIKLTKMQIDAMYNSIKSKLESEYSEQIQKLRDNHKPSKAYLAKEKELKIYRSEIKSLVEKYKGDVGCYRGFSYPLEETIESWMESDKTKELKPAIDKLKRPDFSQLYNNIILATIEHDNIDSMMRSLEEKCYK